MKTVVFVLSSRADGQMYGHGMLRDVFIKHGVVPLISLHVWVITWTNCNGQTKTSPQTCGL